MNRVMNFFVLSCKKITELIEKRTVVGLTPKEKIQLEMHTCICAVCKSYEKQSAILDKTLAHIYKNKTEDNILSSEKKQEIIDSIKKK